LERLGGVENFCVFRWYCERPADKERWRKSNAGFLCLDNIEREIIHYDEGFGALIVSDMVELGRVKGKRFS
jgi:hypothetical protein